jgi:hypothetical protein
MLATPQKYDEVAGFCDEVVLRGTKKLDFGRTVARRAGEWVSANAVKLESR